MITNISKPEFGAFVNPVLFSPVNIQKNYIFNYIKSISHASFAKHKLSNKEPFYMLDAASQSLLGRVLFPVDPLFRYVGLDIEANRLKEGVRRKLMESDTAFLFDIAGSKASKDVQFDLVVSSNTLSHIHEYLWGRSFRNLISFVRPMGDLYINMPINSSLNSALSLLNNNFVSVDFFYYTSYLSTGIENKIKINSIHQLASLVADCETSIPNNPIYHSQVMVVAKCRVDFSTQQVSNYDFLYKAELQKLNNIPCVDRLSFKNIREFLSSSNFNQLRRNSLYLTSDLYANADDHRLLMNSIDASSCISISASSFNAHTVANKLDQLSGFRNYILIGAESRYLPNDPIIKDLRESFNCLRSYFSEGQKLFYSASFSEDSSHNKLELTDLLLHG